MTKRLIALLLSVMMVVTLLPAGIFAADAGGETPPAVNELIYSTEGIDHSWHSLAKINEAVKIIDSPDSNMGSLDLVNETAVDMSEGGIVKTMPANTWAFGYVVEFTGKAEITIPFGATVLNILDGNLEPKGQGIKVNLNSYDTTFSIPGAGVYVIMTAAQNVYGGSNNNRIIKSVQEYYVRLRVAGSVNVRVLGSVAATVSDLSTITGADGATNASLYYSDLLMTVDGKDYTFTGLTEGAMGKNEDGTIAVSRKDNRATPSPALVVDKPTAPAAEEGYVNNLVGFATEEGGEATILYTDNSDGTITLDGYGRNLYPVWFKVPVVESTPTPQDGWFGNGNTMKIPNTATDTIPNEGVQVWNGNAQFNEAASAITFVFEVNGVDSKIDATKVNPYFTNQDGASKSWASQSPWQWSNGWGGVFCPQLNIEENGVYYLYLNSKALADNTKPFAIKSVQSFNIFSKQGNVVQGARTNTNDNATFRMLAVVANDLKPEVNFYDADGELLTTQSYKYTDYGNVNVGDGTTGITDGINNKKAKQTGTIITTKELFSKAGVPAPTQPNDGKSYRFYWADEKGNPVEAIYKSQNIYATWEEVDAGTSIVKFLGNDGSTLEEKTMKMGDVPVYTGDTPVKHETDSETYVFAGWSRDGVTVVDLANEKLDAVEVVYKPIFASVPKIRASLVEVKPVSFNKSGTYGIKLDNTQVTVDAVAGTKTLITGGTVTVTSDAFTGANGEKTFDVTFDSVDENGVTNAEFTLTPPANNASTYGVTLGGTVTGDGASATLTDNTNNVTITGQQVGQYYGESAEIKTLHKTVVGEDGTETPPAEQEIWSDTVDFGGLRSGITFVMKATGIETPVELARINISFINQNEQLDHFDWKWFYNNPFWGGATISSRTLAIEKDGYYLLYINRRLFDGDAGVRIRSVKSFDVFTNKGNNVDGDPTKVNKNDNAKLQMIAVVCEDLQPTITFHNEDGSVYGTPYKHIYTEVGETTDDGNKARQTMSLITVGDAISAAKVDGPVKADDESYVYTFAGWTDAEGNSIDGNALYMNTDVYPKYTATPKTKSYTVTFKNGEEVFATQEVWENGHVTVPETEPTKADDATGTFTFAGWSLDGTNVIDPTTVVITEAKEFVAVYTHIDVEFTVTYMDGDKEFYKETVVRSKDAAYTGTPTRATDAYVDDATPAFYHRFDKWTNADGTDAKLTNIQDNLIVYSQFKDVPVETWHKVTWYAEEHGGNENGVKYVADGDPVEAYSWAVGNLVMNGKADENNWYTFAGWDKETTCVTADMSIYPTYDLTPIVTGAMPYKTATVSGNIGEKHVLWNEETTLDKAYNGVTVILRVTGASADNPVRIGDVYARADNNSSNNAWFMIENCENKGLIDNITDEGWHYITLGANVISNDYLATQGKTTVMQYLALDDPQDTRAASSSGNGSYEAYMFMGAYHPTVRFYAEDRTWLETQRYTYDYSHGSVIRGSLVTPAELYKGTLPENFLYWADADGNEVTEVYDNMDLYAVCACEHENCTAIGDGIAKCDKCGEVVNNAPTVVSGPKELPAMQAGDTFTVPAVITNNPGLVGITLNVETSTNVKFTSASVDGTLFDGAMITTATNIVINRGESPENVIADGTVVDLTFTALSEIKTGDTVSIKVNVTDTSATDDTAPTVWSGLTVEYKSTIEPATVNYDSLGFTVGNTLALKVNLKCNQLEDTYTMCDTWTMYLDVETEPGVWETIDSQTLDRADNITFNLTGIPAAYIVNDLRVRFEGNGKYGVKYMSEKDKMVLDGKEVGITFVNYSVKAKAEVGGEELNKLLNSMLNYAAEVQKYKNYKVDNLANKDLADDEKSFMSIDDQNYDWTPYASQKRGVTPYADKAVKIKSSQLLLGTDKVGFRFYFNAKGEDVSTLTAKVKYTENGNTVEKEISEFITVSESDGEYYAVFDGFDPTSFGTQVEVSVYKNGEKISNIAYDSIPTMAKQVATDGKHVTMRPVLSTILAYSDAANKYVAKP